MTEMRMKLDEMIANVHMNIRLGLTNEIALEEAIAMFRIARCLAR